MIQSALKTAGSLLLLASIIQGLQDVPVFHYKTMEVLVGQNTSLPCFIKNNSTNKFISSEWTKKDIKLALYSNRLPPLTFVPNVTLKIVYNATGEARGTHVEVTNINKGDAGTYVCSITTYPGGVFRTETELIVKDKIKCDMNSSIEVNSGENMTIHCDEFPNVTYNWFKDGVQVSDTSSLQLLSVSEASDGIYTLLANTGNSRLQTTFTIKVFTQTTDYWAGSTSTSTYNHSISNRSEETSYSTVFGTDDKHNSTPTTTVSYSRSTASQNTTASQTYTQPQPSEGFNQSVTYHTTINNNQSESFENVTNVSRHSNSSQATSTDISYNHSRTTPPPFAHDTSTEYALINDTGSTLNKTQLPGDSLSKAFTSSVSTLNASTGGVNTGASLNSTPGSTTVVAVQQDPPNPEGQSHLVLTLCIIGGAFLFIVVLVLVRRRMIKKRMDLPPSFKPPPPPIKYTAVRNPQQQFPTDRCNSITAGGSMEMRHTFV